MCDCTHEEKIHFEGFTQNSCYGNQPHPFGVLIYCIEGIDANSFCSFTKQDFTFKQAHLVSVCRFGTLRIKTTRILMQLCMHI